MIKIKNVLIIITVIILVVVLLYIGRGDKLEEPAFVKELVSSEDMDVDIEFFVSNKSDLKVVDVEIPNMPNGFSLDFYDDVDEVNGCYGHWLSIEFSADDLSDSGGLSEPFVFHEIIIKWDDESETRANIGTVHLAESYEPSDTFEWYGTEYVNFPAVRQEVVQEFTATQDLSISKIDIPYYDEVSDYIKDITLDGRNVFEITEENPLVVEKGKTYIMNYIEDTSVPIKYGFIFLEGKIIGIDKHGNEHTNMFYIQARDGRDMIDVLHEAIKYAE